MNKRIMKRHMRQVLRAREHVRVSEPDTRTPEQIKAAREASRSGGVRGKAASSYYSLPSNAANQAGVEVV